MVCDEGVLDGLLLAGEQINAKLVGKRKEVAPGTRIAFHELRDQLLDAGGEHLGLADRLSHLSDAEKRAYILADNKLAEKAGWDKELLVLTREGAVFAGSPPNWCSVSEQVLDVRARPIWR
jgi:hypothetical protein